MPVKTKKEIKPELSKKNLLRAKKLLFDVVGLCEESGIGYHLEGGTLLGFVRDNGLLPWDYDLDISMLPEEAGKFLKVCNRLLYKGYKTVRMRFDRDIFNLRKNDYRVLKVRPFVLSVIKECIPLFRKIYVTLDIFVKYPDKDKIYWQAKEKIMCVDKKYYESYETIECYGRIFRVPNLYKEYLTQKYGDWAVPVREWDCGRDEKTICGSII